MADVQASVTRARARKFAGGSPFWATLPILLMVGAAGYSLGKAWFAPGERVANLMVTHGSLDFGEVYPQRKFRWKIPIQNPTSFPVSIRQFKASCACTSIDPSSIHIPARSSAEITVTLDLTRFGRSSETVRPFAVELVPIVDSPRLSGTVWRLTGRIRDPAMYTPRELDFADSLVAGQPYSPRKVTVRFREPVSSVSASCPSWFGTATLRTTANDTELTVTPSSELPSGSFEAQIEIAATSMRGTALEMPPLQVRGAICGPVKVIPETIVLGAVPVGERSAGLVTLRSRIDRPIEVIDVRTSDPAIEIVQSSQGYDNDTEIVFNVTRLHVKKGLDRATLEFTVVDPLTAEAATLVARVLSQGVD